MTDISKHPLLKACYEACLAVEKLGASPDQTDAVSRVSDMGRPIEALVDDLAAAQATIQQQARELEEAEAVIQLFGDAATDTFEQMLRGHWTDDHGHPVPNNTAMLSLKMAVEKAMVFRSALAQQAEAKKEE